MNVLPPGNHFSLPPAESVQPPRVCKQPPPPPLPPTLAKEKADQQAIENAKGQAVTNISLESEEPQLSSTHYKNGNVTVQGFPAGNPPSIKEVLEIAFPLAKDVKIVGSNHEHPFNTYQLEVDGKPYIASFLYGGFMPSDRFDIQPGKSTMPMQPYQDHGPAQQPATPQIELAKPELLEQEPAIKEHNQILIPRSKPVNREPDLKVEKHPDGGKTVYFKPGEQPSLTDVMESAFPNAKEVKLLSSSHLRPFDSYKLLVDGKPYTASFLWGGIVSSHQYNIFPGHDKNY